MTETLSRALDAWAPLLLGPTLAALVLCLAATALFLGGALAEARRRGAARRAIERALALVEGCPAAHDVVDALRASPGGLARRFAEAYPTAAAPGAGADRALARAEAAAERAVAPLSLLARAAPMLGLMATLIPIAPALSGLAQGRVSDVAGGLAVAFSATVAGLLASVLAVALAALRRGWYERDLDDLEAIARALGGRLP